MTEQDTARNAATTPGGTASDDTGLDDTASQLRVAVLRLARLLRLQDQGELAPTLGFTLATIAREGPLTISELAASEHVAVPTMSAVVAKLEERSLVRRLRDPSDGRVCRVEITDEGMEHLRANQRRRTRWLAEQLEAMDPDELARLRSSIEVLTRLSAPSTGARQ